MNCFKSLSLFLFITIPLFSIALMIPKNTHSQAVPGISNPIIISTVPNIPSTNTNVTIKLNSFIIDLDKAMIIWTVNGEEVSSGVGKKEIVVNSGGPGTFKLVEVTAGLVGVGTFSEAIVIKPADVGLVWEAATYTPPFYKGKALYSFGSTFRVTALPEFISSSGERMDPKSLVYTWSKNGSVQGGDSGYGKTTFTTSQSSYVREGEEISVEVYAPNEDIVATRSITVRPTPANIIFYEKSPLYGTIYEKALENNFNLKNEEITILAEPYNFSVDNRDSSSLERIWTINKEELYDFKDKSFLTLRKVGGSGSSNIGLTLQHTNRLLQGANAFLNIRYE